MLPWQIQSLMFEYCNLPFSTFSWLIQNQQKLMVLVKLKLWYLGMRWTETGSWEWSQFPFYLDPLGDLPASARITSVKKKRFSTFRRFRRGKVLIVLLAVSHFTGCFSTAVCCAKRSEVLELDVSPPSQEKSCLVSFCWGGVYIMTSGE